MKKLITILAGALVLTCCSLPLFAGTPKTTMDCKSASGHASILGC